MSLFSAFDGTANELDLFAMECKLASVKNWESSRHSEKKHRWIKEVFCVNLRKWARRFKATETVWYDTAS